MDDQLQELRHRIIRTVTRRILIGFAVAFTLVYAIQVARGVVGSLGDLLVLGLLVQNLVLAQLLVLGWLLASFMMNPLGGRYLRLLASSPSDVIASVPSQDSLGRVSDLGLHGLRPVAQLSIGDDGEHPVDVYQTADRKVTVVLDDGVLTAMSRLNDGRVFVTTDLMLVPCAELLINLKPGAAPDAAIQSHLRTATKLSRFDLSVVPDSAAIAADVLAIERRALMAIGPVAGVFLGLHGSARSHRLLVSPNRQDLLAMGLGYKQSPSSSGSGSGPVTPLEQSNVDSTDFRSNEMMVSSSSS